MWKKKELKCQIQSHISNVAQLELIRYVIRDGDKRTLFC